MVVPSATEPNLDGRSILIVDDHEPHRTLLINYLGGLGARCVGASGGNEGLAAMQAETFDLVLLDLAMEDLDGMEVLRRAQGKNFAHHFVMMSAQGTISNAVEAIRLGAHDFLVKPFELEQLLALVQRVLRTSAPGAEPQRDPRLVWRDDHAPDLIGESARLLDIFLVLERISNTDCTVLVTGESGTGKELVARAVHTGSGRRDEPFVPVNCGAIPETLIESELFGHAKGAFSGATHSREGRFAVADGGTLFLDEIGEMSLSVQVKFLRVLQEQEYVPVGETRPRKCDVRIIAATNKNLEQMTKEGKFREDLFYRLNLIPIQLPSLRERSDDVPRLVQHFLERTAKRRSGDMLELSSAAGDLMARYSWPGNVRELENTVERMTLLHRGDGVLDIVDLPPKIQQMARREAIPDAAALREAPGSSAAFAPTPAAGTSAQVVAFPDAAARAVEPAVDAARVAPAAAVAAPAASAATRPLASPTDFVLPDEGLDLRKAVQAFEMSLIDQALERTGGNKNQASLLLGMNRTTLVEKLRKRQAK